MHRMPLVIPPETDQHIGRNHYQGGALRKVLVHSVQVAEHRNGDQPAANAEQTACNAKAHAEQQIDQTRENRVRRHADKKGGTRTNAAARCICYSAPPEVKLRL